MTEEQREYVYLAHQSCHSLLQIISDILDYSTIEVQKMKLHKDAFCIRKLIRDINGLFTPAIREKKLDFHCTISPEIPEKLWETLFGCGRF